MRSLEEVTCASNEDQEHHQQIQGIAYNLSIKVLPTLLQTIQVMVKTFGQQLLNNHLHLDGQKFQEED